MNLATLQLRCLIIRKRECRTNRRRPAGGINSMESTRNTDLKKSLSLSIRVTCPGRSLRIISPLRYKGSRKEKARGQWQVIQISISSLSWPPTRKILGSIWPLRHLREWRSQSKIFKSRSTTDVSPYFRALRSRIGWLKGITPKSEIPIGSNS